MSEWWTYTPSDFLLFSPRTYYRLIELYNAAIWPGQLVALVAGLAILVLVRRAGPSSGRIVAAILAAGWLWVAWGYLFTRYATINWAASYVAAAFAIETLLLAVAGVIAGKLTFHGGGRWVGLGLFLFALFIQPLIGPLSGRAWSRAELFGVMPDPTVVATLGVLLAADRVRWELLAVPLLWCLFSGATLWTMEAPDAWVMPLAAGLTVAELARRRF
ncbi:DUF6064 family protein [Azospirillum soli]|uniref:DUF6064 family protein n=1 Tax=Azospirillum soli TaxID=1304799 RepID=UPI001AE9216C|nr:DUF6064 family protein [Azospirillum soli]MBP2312823.1 hypothetical protein [Azospirillum soli]